MKKIILALFLVVLLSKSVFGFETDYRQIYMDLEVPTFSYIHGIDPGQYYDTKNTTWSPYPLFRLTSPLYFKTIAIQPGYYLLTPTNHKGKDYLLFKEVGLVKYIIPVYKKELVPEGFYDAHLPKPKLRFSQKVEKHIMTFVGKHIKSAQRKPIPQSYLEVEDLDNKFVSIVVYFGEYRYYTIFRTVQM